MPETAIRELTFAQAVREALAEEMRRDPRVCILEKMWRRRGHRSRCFPGWWKKFGIGARSRHADSEAGFTGNGRGAAMTGLRPVVDIMFGIS